MYQGQTLFSQVLRPVQWTTFARIVARYEGDRRIRSLSCAQQFRAMAFGQLTERRSLRDLCACLQAVPAKLSHAGFDGPVHFSTLARANERRDWRIHADFAQRLIARARDLYAGEDSGLDLDDTVYALDSSTIDLCLSMFPWANFRATKAAVKLHTLLDLRGSIPAFIHVSDGKLHDVNVLDMLAPEAGAVYLMDRAYVDFQRLYRLHQAGAFFVTRLKKNILYHRVYSFAKDTELGILADQSIALDGRATSAMYPERLRRISFRDPDSGRKLVFITNRTDLDAPTTCALYKQRWQVELFFRWVKGHLRIQRFYGTSENAVKSQIWIAVSVYVLVAIVRKKLGIPASMHAILQVLSVMPFEKVPLREALTKPSRVLVPDPCPEQTSFDFETAPESGARSRPTVDA